MTNRLKPFEDRLSKAIGHFGMTAGTLKLDIAGLGSLLVAGFSVSESNGAADCTIKVDPELLDEFLNGTFDPHWALVCGRITYAGDFAVARAFGSLVCGPRPS